MMTDTRSYVQAYFREKRTKEKPPGPTLARYVIEKWSDGWCCSRKANLDHPKHDHTTHIDEGMQFLSHDIFEQIYFSPSTQQWEAVDEST